VFLRSQLATIGAISYLLAFLAASFYPHISHQAFAGRPAALLLWPWSNLLHPSSQIVLIACAVLNAAIIYAVLALSSVLATRFLRRPL
jgi:hypothetical protein